METVSFDDFKKADIRIGKILSAERIEGSDKLLKLEVDFGSEKRQIIAGIAQFYAPEALVGKSSPFAFNLAPRMLKSFESQGMILCADDGRPFLLHPDGEVQPGSMIK